MKLLKVDTISIAREKLLKVMQNQKPASIRINLLSAQDYILAVDIVSSEPVPAFRRSTVDGYAVVAKDTQGASENLPVFLEIIDEVMMGAGSEKEMHSGECVYVPTGGMIPIGADAMVMVEYCELFDSNHVAVYNSAASGRFIVEVGEDMKEGELVLKKGTKLHPQDIGVLASLGIIEVEVYKPWTVTILSTGDELVSPSDELSPGKIRDINTYSLYAKSREMRFEVLDKKVLEDKEELLKQTMLQAMENSDLIIVSGGSSQGKKDVTQKVMDEIASPGSFTHGLALKPGKPTILGFDDRTDTLLMGLPGHPVAAILVYELLIGWLWKQSTNQKEEPSVFARITSNIAGAPGKMTCQLVQLKKQGMAYEAEPILGKSGLITTLTRANGYIIIDQNKEGINKDEIVEVFYI